MSETITLSPGGPHSPAYTRQLANAAAEAIRVLNHATFQTSSGALAYPAGVDAVIEALATMHARLPQLYGQLTEWLRGQLAAGRLQIGHGPFRGDPAAAVAEVASPQALDRWRHRWRCPGTAELRDADRTLRLALGEPAHAAILRAHLQRHRDAVLTEAAATAEFGWLGGHAHEIAFPLVTVRSAAPAPITACLPTVTNAAHGQLPGSPGAAWLYAKIHSHPERHDEIIAEHLPRLLTVLGGEPRYCLVRYRSPHETDHLRLRIRTSGAEHYAAYSAAVGRWVQRMRYDRLAGRLVIDTYYPEIGRYGQGAAMGAAEEVFAADSRVVCAALRHLPATMIHRTALAAVNMMDIASGFLGSLADAARWLAARPAPTATAADGLPRAKRSALAAAAACGICPACRARSPRRGRPAPPL